MDGFVGHFRFNFFLFNLQPKICLMIFREKRKGKGEEQGWRGERKRETNIKQLPPGCTLTGDETHNLGIYADGNQTGKLWGMRGRTSQQSHLAGLRFKILM